MVSAAADWVCFLLLTTAGMWAVSAQAASSVGGAGVSFGLNKVWTYGSVDATRTRGEAVRFTVLYVVSLGFNLVVMYALVDVLGVADAPAKLVADTGRFLFNFVVMRQWVFAVDRREAEG